MYKPPKREDLSKQMKVTHPVVDGMPASKDVRAMLDECQLKKGMQIEQAWTTSNPSQKFILICQLQEGSKQPVWTLYEENEGSSKMHWSQPFEPNDFSMMYDVICMSAPDAGRATAIPDNLKPGANDSKSSPGSAASSAPKPAPASTGSSVPAAGSGYPAPAGGNIFPAPAGGNIFPAPGVSAFPSPNSSGTFPAPGANTFPAPAPGAGYPAPAGGGYPAPPAGGGYPAPAPGYPAPPQMPYAPPPQPPYPGGYPQPQAPYPPPQGYAGGPPQWQQQGYGAPYQQGAPSAAPSGSTFSAQIQTADPRTPVVDYNLLSQRANILLGELMFEAGLITEPTLEAALKIQEFVREERMSPTQACEVLKKHHGLGGSIDNYLSPEDFDLDAGNKPAAKKSSSFSSTLASASQGTTAAKSSGGGAAKSSASTSSATSSSSDVPKSERIKLQLASFDLLQKAGLLKADDLQTAHAVYKKHGGDIVQMLTAANKIDATTYKAAETCVPLIQENKMKVEQCIIALNYCMRSRVDFDSALDEMGWENPRKQK